MCKFARSFAPPMLIQPRFATNVGKSQSTEFWSTTILEYNMEYNIKNRASSLFIIAAVTFCAGASAADNLPQKCADAAFIETGESNFNLKKSRQMMTGVSWHELVLSSKVSDLEVTCKIRRGRVTQMHTQGSVPYSRKNSLKK